MPGIGKTTWMLKGFGPGLALFLAAGILAPGEARAMVPLGFGLLLLLLVLNALQVRPVRPSMLLAALRPLGLGLLVTYGLVPLLVVAAAHLLLDDRWLVFGVAVAALTPVAVVAPHFAAALGHDEVLAALLVFVSMALCPVVFPLGLWGFGFDPKAFPLLFLAKLMAALVLGPLLFAALWRRLAPGTLRPVLAAAPAANFLLLGALMYVLVAMTWRQYLAGSLPFCTLVVLAGLLLAQSLLPLALVPLLAGTRFSPPVFGALVASCSMRNAALAVGLLLLVEPRAAVAPAFGLLANAVIFSLLPWVRAR